MDVVNWAFLQYSLGGSGKSTLMSPHNVDHKLLLMNSWSTSKQLILTFYLQSIMSYNGGAVIAMKGKECVAIASDLRYGVQAQTVSFDFQKVFQMNDKLFLGLAGLATDVQTV